MNTGLIPEWKIMRRSLALGVAVVVLLAGCTSDSEEAVSTTTPPPATTPTSQPVETSSTTTARPATTTAVAPPTRTSSTVPVVPPGAFALAPFGTLQAVPLLDETTAYAGPPTPTSLAGVRIYDPLAAALSDPTLRAMLADQGFAVAAGSERLFHHAYGYSLYAPYPVFVTTDAALHAWHQTFDKVLRDVEEESLLPALERLVAGLVERGREQREALAGTALEDAADRASQLYEAAATVLGLDVGPIGALAEQEVALILEHAQYTASPLTSFEPCETGSSPANCVDYSLYKPRGHYTRSVDLERYFRAMSVLGQSAFFLDVDSLRLGILASRVLLADDAAVADWQLIYEPTAFLVGAADDYTPFEVAGVAGALTPDGLAAVEAFADPVLVESVAEGLRALRPVLINPEASSARVMGVRLTLDSYIIDQLVHPTVERRLVASVRDVAAAFGSDWAYASLQDDGYTDYAGYDNQLEAMRTLVAGRTDADWGRTVYDAWLHAIAPTWLPHGAAFPDFMQTEAWAAKAHQTGFSSYAELKHDTILYTKQAIAEGGNGRPPPPPRHWVEPDPVVYERIAAAAALLREGLTSRGLLTAGNTTTLQYLEEEMAFLARIARDELAGRPIAEQDNEQLQSFGGWLEMIWLNTSDLDRIGEDGGPDEDAALIADIMLSAEFGALEVATGKIDRIYVLVPADDGVFQVAAGGVYSFYEFWQDPTNRLTDEEWRVMLDAGEAPARPAWTESFLLDR